MLSKDLSSVPHENIAVACVCGNEVRTYGPKKKGTETREREFSGPLTFPSHGAARLWAQEFEEAEKRRFLLRQR